MQMGARFTSSKSYRASFGSRGLRGLVLIGVFLAFPSLPALSPAWASSGEPYARYFADTFASLEQLRAPKGLIRDKILLSYRGDFVYGQVPTASDYTSPTNMALDLLVQISAIRLGVQPAVAEHNLETVIATLAKLSVHPASGFFFNWYSTNTLQAIDFGLSSVDNIHMAAALWVVSHEYAGTPLGKAAAGILAKLDFTPFYRQGSGLFAGAMTYDDSTNSPQWILQNWDYSYFGSESRSIYALSWALGLFKDPEFLDKAPHSWLSEIYCWKESASAPAKPILRVWDGGGFQLLLPETLIGESGYSSELHRAFQNYEDFIIAQGKSTGLSVPAAFSASEASPICRQDLPCYNGKSGSPELIATTNQDYGNPDLKSRWDAVFTPHAAIMASQADPAKLASAFLGAESLFSGAWHLYQPGWGWMDGYRVKNPEKGEVIPVLLSLDQEMIALALSRNLSPDGMGTAARSFAGDAGVKDRLTQFYARVDHDLGGKSSCLNHSP